MKIDLYTGLQGFALAAILIAYVADYNRSQLPFALMCLIFSVMLRVLNRGEQ